jgi:hypothetical protein
MRKYVRGPTLHRAFNISTNAETSGQNNSVESNVTNSGSYWVSGEIVNLSSDSSARPNSLRGEKFAALHHTLLTLSTLHDDHDYHLPRNVAQRASDFLGVLSKNLDIDPPLFFPQDGEAAVFTWDVGSIKRLLTVDSDELDLMAVNRKNMVRCDYDLPSDPEEQLGELITLLGVQITSSSTQTSGQNA